MMRYLQHRVPAVRDISQTLYILLLLGTYLTGYTAADCIERHFNETATILRYKNVSQFRATLRCHSHPQDTVWLRNGEVKGKSIIKCEVDCDYIFLDADTRPAGCSLDIDVNFVQIHVNCTPDDSVSISTVSPNVPLSLHTNSSKDDVSTSAYNFCLRIMRDIWTCICLLTLVFCMYCVWKKKRDFILSYVTGNSQQSRGTNVQNDEEKNQSSDDEVKSQMDINKTAVYEKVLLHDETQFEERN